MIPLLLQHNSPDLNFDMVPCHIEPLFVLAMKERSLHGKTKQKVGNTGDQRQVCMGPNLPTKIFFKKNLFIVALRIW